MLKEQTPNESYDPRRAGMLHALLTKTIDDFLKLHPDISKEELLLAIAVTQDAYAQEVYHRWEIGPISLPGH